MVDDLGVQMDSDVLWLSTRLYIMTSEDEVPSYSTIMASSSATFVRLRGGLRFIISDSN